MTGIRVLPLMALFAFSLLGGCAGTSKASDAESSQAKSSGSVPDKGVVFLYRRGRAVGAAVSTQIKINGIEAGGTGPSTFFRWELKPGKYTFHASTKEASATIAVDVKAGQVYYIEQIERMGLTRGGRVQMVVRDAATGMREVKSKKLLVSAYVPAE